MRGEARRWAAAAALVGLLASACGGGSTPGAAKALGSTGPPFVPAGTMLIDTGGFAQQVVEFPLPKGPRRSFGQFFWGSRLGTAWGPRNAVYLMAAIDIGARPETQLFRLNRHTDPTPVGATLRGGSGFVLEASTAVAWTCADRVGSVYTSNLAAPSPTWRRLARGCTAAVSPDGGTIAFADDHDVWEAPASGGEATRVLSLAAVPELTALGSPGLLTTGDSLVLGPQGLAVSSGSLTTGQAIVVDTPGRKPQVVPLGPTSLRWMGWQPGGRLLAFADYILASQQTEIRLFDPATGTVQEIASSGTYGVAWAPTGRVLAIEKSPGTVAFVDPQGDQIGTGQIPGRPLDWRA